MKLEGKIEEKDRSANDEEKRTQCDETRSSQVRFSSASNDVRMFDSLAFELSSKVNESQLDESEAEKPQIIHHFQSSLSGGPGMKRSSSFQDFNKATGLLASTSSLVKLG